MRKSGAYIQCPVYNLNNQGDQGQRGEGAGVGRGLPVQPPALQLVSGRLEHLRADPGPHHAALAVARPQPRARKQKRHSGPVPRASAPPLRAQQATVNPATFKHKFRIIC